MPRRFVSRYQRRSARTTNEVDDPVRFEVTEDVKVGDFIAVPKGSTAVGHVVEVEPKRRLGRAGKLNFSIDHVKAVDR